jgi:hypothetical protein
MPFAEYTTHLHYLMLAVLAFFSIATFVLAIVTLSNAFRLRNVLLRWRTGRFFGFPLFATLFLGLAAAVASVAVYQGLTSYYAVSAAYVFLSLNWVISSYFMSKRYITDHGIVKNINDPSQTVAWHQIHDFMEQPTENGNGYAFMYGAGSSRSAMQIRRIEIEVPEHQVASFRKILNHKLGRRFQYTFEDVPVERDINIRP